MKSKPTRNTCKLCGSLMMKETKTIPERCSNKPCPIHNPHKLDKAQNIEPQSRTKEGSILFVFFDKRQTA